MVLYARALDNGELVVLLEDGTLLRDASRLWDRVVDQDVVDEAVDRLATEHYTVAAA
jgi:hypothetical protein